MKTTLHEKMELGKPDAGKPPVRFDEGREENGHGLSGLSLRLFPPTLQARRTCEMVVWCWRLQVPAGEPISAFV